MKYLNVLFHYQGRITRKWMWLGLLIYPVVWIFVGVLVAVLHEIPGAENYPTVMSFCIAVFLFLSTEAVRSSFCIRRLHDLNLSGWFYLLLLLWRIGIFFESIEKIQYNNLTPAQNFLSLILFTTSIFEFGLFLIAGTKGPNKYGLDPSQNNDLQQARN